MQEYGLKGLLLCIFRHTTRGENGKYKSRRGDSTF